MSNYIMVSGKTRDELEANIKAKEKEGYVRYGEEIHQLMFSDGPGFYYREMVKEQKQSE